MSRTDGSRHEGSFKNWFAEGRGSFVDGNGTAFEGNFSGGTLSGVGRITTKDATSYEGEIKNWMPDGHGRLAHANGDVYVGQFSFGAYDGEGVLTYAAVQPDGRTRDSGRWRRGEFQPREEQATAQARANAELALYSQPALLNRALAGIAASEPKRINLYLLSVAGYGAQEVFRREVEFVRDQFDREFGTAGRSLALINSRETVGRIPMATVTSVRQSLAAIGTKMNRDQDILFVYLTSHGSREHELSLGLRGMDLPGLTAGELRKALDEAAIRWRVVVVSACYAGGFINELRDERTLILTAARHDRRSFGCADENDFTYFGRAFFKESLPASDSFEDAFTKAQALITEWETRDLAKRKAPAAASGGEAAEDRHSLPQIVNPRAIQDHLNHWWRQRLPAGARAREARAKN